LVYYVEQDFGFRDVCHGCAVVGVTDAAVFIDDAHEGHTAEFEDVDLLAIEDRDAMLRIGDADEGDFFCVPVLLVGGFGIWTNGEDLCAALLEL